MTSRVAVLAVAVAALAAPTSAAGGGFATVGLDSLPEGLGPGEPWRVELTILQHGVTPLEGARPRVVVSRGDSRRAFVARSTGRPGIYRASVVFPAAGTWRHAVDDGFSMRHRFPPVRVGGGGDRDVAASVAANGNDGGGGGPDLVLAFAAAALAAGVAGLASAVLMQRPRPLAPEGG